MFEAFGANIQILSVLQELQLATDQNSTKRAQGFLGFYRCLQCIISQTVYFFLIT